MTRAGYAMTLARSSAGGAAAEFALVLPLLLLLMFVMIDGARLLYVTNEAEKATQMGARYAIVTDFIPAALKTDYTNTANCGTSGTSTCTPGDTITNSSVYGPVYCKWGGAAVTCACPSGATCPSASIPTASFTRMVSRMQRFWPSITNANVRVIFRGSGIGFASDPSGMNVIPLVTVELRNVGFRPLSLLTFAAVPLPAFSTTLSAESVKGIQSN